MNGHDAAAVLIRKLESIAELSDGDRQALFGLPMKISDLAADQDIFREGERPSQCCLIADGFTYRYKVTPQGKRQIFSFHGPGDIPDLQSMQLRVMDHNLRALSPCKLAFISHETLNELCAANVSLAAVFWRDSLIDASIFREWITNVGRRSADQRIAHLLCEILARLRAVGVAEGNTFELPVTQVELADATGLSTVHVNRTLQELRAAGLILTRSGKVTVQDWDGLKAAGELDPAYLHLKRAA